MNKKNDTDFLPNLEGLRALAVMSVLVFHVDEAWLPGGFLGVDLFFVISGFIVTKSILERSRQNNLNIVEFYKSRFFRLFPAAATVIFATCVSYFILLAPLIDGSFLQSVFFASFGLANIFFSTQDGYWSDALSVNPFLHYWSLGVEEQFYLFWPFLFLILRTKKAIFFGIGLIATISLVTSVLAWERYSSLVFYLAPFRVWQFSLGAMLLLIVSTIKRQHIYDVCFLISLPAFCYMAITLSGSTGSFSLKMLLPTLVSMTLILGIYSTFADYIWGTKIARLIGAASYSIYLVHWPILVIVKLKYGVSYPVLLFGFVMSLLLGFLLSFYVEKKFKITPQPTLQPRAKKKHTLNHNQSKGLVFFSLPIVSLCLCVYVEWMTNFDKRIKVSQDELSQQAKLSLEQLVKDTTNTSNSNNPTTEQQVLVLEDRAFEIDQPGNRIDKKSRSNSLTTNNFVKVGIEKPSQKVRLTPSPPEGKVKNNYDLKQYNGGDCGFQTADGSRIDKIKALDKCLDGDILVTGSSWSIAAYQIAKLSMPDKKIAYLGSWACAPILDMAHNENNDPSKPGCRDANELRNRIITEKRYKCVIWVSHNLYLDEHMRSWISTFEMLQRSGSKVVITGVRPVFPQPVPQIIAANFVNENIADVNLTKFSGNAKWYYNQIGTLSKLMENKNNLSLYNWNSYLSDSRKLFAFTENGEPIYYDKSHLTADAIDEIAQKMPMSNC